MAILLQTGYRVWPFRRAGTELNWTPLSRGCTVEKSLYKLPGIVGDRLWLGDGLTQEPGTGIRGGKRPDMMLFKTERAK